MEKRYWLGILLGGLLMSAGVGAQTCSKGATPQSTPDSDFTVHNDGTVTHNTTGLTWERCPLGKHFLDNGTPIYQDDRCVGPPFTPNWQEALEDFVYADWRIPNLRELDSIVESCQENPALNPDIFPPYESPGGVIWSSSPSVSDPQKAWAIDFSAGEFSTVDKTKRHNIRLVRSTQP